eukprot:scaffold244698_cov18-Tisochrysis_lutea.AAC.2
MYLLQMCACDQVVLQELRVLPWALQEQLEEVPDQDGAVSDCDGHASCRPQPEQELLDQGGIATNCDRHAPPADQ